jgi:hypothetical protein
VKNASVLAIHANVVTVNRPSIVDEFKEIVRVLPNGPEAPFCFCFSFWLSACACQCGYSNFNFIRCSRPSDHLPHHFASAQMALFSRLLEPFTGHVCILLCTPALFVANSNIELRLREALHCCHLVPLKGLR